MPVVAWVGGRGYTKRFYKNTKVEEFCVCNAIVETGLT